MPKTIKTKRFSRLLISNMSNIFGFALFLPLYGTYIIELGTSPQNGSYLWAAHTLLIGLAVLMVGRIEDKHKKGYARALIFGNLLQVLGVLLFLTTTSIQLFTIGLMVYSLGTAILAPSWFTLFAGSIDKKHSAKGWSISQGGGALAGSAGSAVGGMLFAFSGFTIVFAAALVFHMIGLLLAASAIRTSSKSASLL